MKHNNSVSKQWWKKKMLSKKNYELEDWWNSSKSDSMQVGSEDEYL